MSKQNGTEKTPTKWVKEQMWRKVFPWDEWGAENLRLMMSALNLYPAKDLRDDEGHNTHEANSRAAIVDMIAELDRNDIIALANAARVLAIIPRHSVFFDAMASSRQRTEQFLTGKPSRRRAKAAA